MTVKGRLEIIKHKAWEKRVRGIKSFSGKIVKLRHTQISNFKPLILLKSSPCDSGNSSHSELSANEIKSSRALHSPTHIRIKRNRKNSLLTTLFPHFGKVSKGSKRATTLFPTILTCSLKFKGRTSSTPRLFPA